MKKFNTAPPSILATGIFSGWLSVPALLALLLAVLLFGAAERAYANTVDAPTNTHLIAPSSIYDDVRNQKGPDGFATALYAYWYKEARYKNAIYMKCIVEDEYGDKNIKWRKAMNNTSLSKGRTFYPEKSKGANGNNFLPWYGWHCKHGYVEVTVTPGWGEYLIGRLPPCPDRSHMVRFAFIDHISPDRKSASLVTFCTELWKHKFTVVLAPKLLDLKWGTGIQRISNIPGELRESSVE